MLTEKREEKKLPKLSLGKVTVDVKAPQDGRLLEIKIQAQTERRELSMEAASHNLSIAG